MNGPSILADNVFSRRIYSSHTLAASSTATGKSVEYLWSMRRIRDLTGWFASSLNTDAYVQSTFDMPRAFDLLWIDRDHNLDGQTVSVTTSDDGFTTEQTMSATVPSSTTPSASLLDGAMIRTNEGALLWYVGLQTAWAVRVEIAAMGSGLRPEIANVMLGLSYQPDVPAVKPFDYGRPNLTHTVSRSPRGQDSTGEPGSYREIALHLRMSDWLEYAEALYPVEDLFAKRRPTVFVPSMARAETAFLARAMPGQQGFEVPDAKYHPEVTLRAEEMEPVLI